MTGTDNGRETDWAAIRHFDMKITDFQEKFLKTGSAQLWRMRRSLCLCDKLGAVPKVCFQGTAPSERSPSELWFARCPIESSMRGILLMLDSC